ncbi:Hypothetical predicted protein [Paramuricea clavata]|nr:Hypothetical predicted protein [Paramuricea clavata]
MWRYVLLLFKIFSILQTILGETPRGHMKPLGEHRSAEIETEEIIDDLHPLQFWKHYVKAGIPVLFPGAAKNSEAYKSWTEEYMMRKFGDLTVKMEARSENSDRIPVGEIGLGKDTIKNFLKNYQAMDSYVISQIPQQMEVDIELPACLGCGSFLQNIQETHLFLSAGGGKTMLHRDPFSSIHCVFNGTKQWLTIHPSQTHLIYQSEESRYEYGGFSEIDVDHVDLEEFPMISEVKYSKVVMNKGDCLFMPQGYWHQVRSNGYMNTAVSIWFSNMTHFDSTGCPSEIPASMTLRDADVLWRYPGNGDFTHGNHDIYLIKRLLLSWADEDGNIDLNTLTKKFFVYNEESKRREILEDDTKQRARKFVEFLDDSGSGTITKENVEKMSIDRLKQATLLFAPTDVSNTLDYEYSHIEESSIRKLFKYSFKDDWFDSSTFIEGYMQELGGSMQKARELVASLLGSKETGTYTELQMKLDGALINYHNSRAHDPTMERELHKHLALHDEL